MPRRSPTQELSSLRKHRVWSKPELSIGPLVEAMRKNLAARANASAGLEDAWAALAPPELRDSGVVGALSAGGILTIKASNSSAKFEIEVWLRGGGEAALRSACTRTLQRVRVK
ncbi:MAG: hypothetical protein WC718_10480 [Phycisphaerales bacterium]|jgi:hypothetical protein